MIPVINSLWEHARWLVANEDNTTELADAAAALGTGPAWTAVEFEIGEAA